MRIIHSTLIVIFVAATAVFCLQNMTAVAVSYLGWNARIPLAALVLAVYLLGAVSGWGLLSFLRRSFHSATKRPD